MSVDRVDDAINKIYNIYTDFHDRFEIGKQTILADESLTNDEKSEAMRRLNEDYDYHKILYNKGTKRICENCQLECLATSYCEHCIRNYLKANFSNWTSGNVDIDDLIQKCQIETVKPTKVVEWIPYNNLQNINYLTKGGCSEIYTAEWIGGCYKKWDSKEQQLKRFGMQIVILKRLENVESANRSWFDEAKSHLTLSNKWEDIVRCYGLTQDPLNKDYMLVMNKMHIDLGKYLNQNHNQLTWKKRIQITYEIMKALEKVHHENAIHRDFHSGNILYGQDTDEWYISDLGFCGPADRPLKSIYGKLSYIAPEVISGKGNTFASDIYSIAMLMWEISSGQPPFANYKYSDYDLAMDIVNGMRPKILPGTPFEYKSLMQQCWDADPLNRPDIDEVLHIIREIKTSYQNEDDNQSTDNGTNIVNRLQTSTSTSSINSLVRKFSKVHIFEGLPEPKNATEEEQEAYSKKYDFEIPENIEDIISEQNMVINDENSKEKNHKSKRIYPDDEKEDLNNKSKKIKFENNKEICAQYTYNDDYSVQYVQRNCIANNVENVEIYNNPNLHSEDQDQLEIPEDGF